MKSNNQTTGYDAQRYLLVVIAALTPCFMMGVYVFGLDMLDNMLGGCGLAVLLAWLMGKVSDAVRSKSSEAGGRPDDPRQSKPSSAVSGSSGSAGVMVPNKAHDMEPEYLAAAITGALIVYGLPSTIPIWIVFAGVAAAMIPAGILVKWLQKADGNKLDVYSNDRNADGYERNVYGNRRNANGKERDAGRNGCDAACLLERAAVTAAFAQTAIWVLFREEATTWPLNDFVETRVSPGDVATGMTPLGILADGGDIPGLSRMFVGFISGPCGEVSVAAVLIGGVYLIWKKIISPLVPVCVLAVLFAAVFTYYMTAMSAEELSALTGSNASGAGAAFYLACYHVLAGGAAFGAFFTAAFAAPERYGPAKNNAGLQIFYGAGIGLITVFFRIAGIFVEGMAAPVLIMWAVTLCAGRVLMKRRK
ncbi:MAG: RnfABCDGE type electron transport complex subunit D [Eubacterium sp.]|nr:RnfABCDGE type electron transport complex subunit D [Eubacterium sp.]